MTNPISARLREVGEDAKRDTPDILWSYPDALFGAADHIDAQDATIKAMVEAFQRLRKMSQKGSLSVGLRMSKMDEIARASIAAAKEPT